MVQPMCFPSLIVRPICFSALFLNSGLQIIIYLFMAVDFFFPFSFNNGSFQETPKDFAQIWLRSGPCQPCPHPAPSHCTSPRGGNSQGRVAALNQFTSELTQGKVKAGNLLLALGDLETRRGRGSSCGKRGICWWGMWRGCGSPGDTAPCSSQSHL